MKTLLLEIGTEEIPAGYIEPALNTLSSNLLQKMTDARIDHGKAKIFATPRRLTVEVKKVADKQTPMTSEILGPPEKVGFDNKGRPTVAAKKFAEKGKTVSRSIPPKTKSGKQEMTEGELNVVKKGVDVPVDGVVEDESLPDVEGKKRKKKGRRS